MNSSVSLLRTSWGLQNAMPSLGGIARKEIIVDSQLVVHQVVKNAEVIDIGRGHRVSRWDH